MGLNATALASRYEGRLFLDEGRLHFVLAVDSASGVARVSCRVNGEPQVLQMPISEVGWHLSSSSNLRLDGLSDAHSANRIIRRADGWFFTTREGPNGPYPSETKASSALSVYIQSARGNLGVGVEHRETESLTD